MGNGGYFQPYLFYKGKVPGKGAWSSEAGTDWPRRSLALGQEGLGLAGHSMLCQKKDTGAERLQGLRLVLSLAQDHLPAHPTRKQNEEWS